MKHFLWLILLGIGWPAMAQNYPEMVLMPSGQFMMGVKQGEPRYEEQWLHSVSVSQFSISRTEVTLRQWKLFCRDAGRKMPELPAWDSTDTHPIVNISWYDAVDYTDWLSEKTGKKYRLPTEAEWEYAAISGRNDGQTRYCGGQQLDVLGWYAANSRNSTQPVAQLRPNDCGLFDMSGNVMEWCLDRYGAYPSTPSKNPFGPSTGNFRVTRGGSWYNTAVGCQISSREKYLPTVKNDFTGFRVVCLE